MKLQEAQKIAEKYLNILKPYCQKIRIAGSIRREKPEVKDIEIVAIPQDLEGFSAEVNKLQKVKGEPTGKYTQRILPEGIKLDLFMANERNWGNIFLIRTGNWQFSKQIMNRILRMGLKQRDGYLWQGDKMLECKEEDDIFNILKLDFISPKNRNNETYAF
jgi:DNA polymerase/3'-5' exonuclease PolX